MLRTAILTASVIASQLISAQTVRTRTLVSDSRAAAAPARLIGVYDLATGDPIAGAEVRDVTSQSYLLTDGAGSLSLSFLPHPAATVRVRKLGFRDSTFAVATGPADTIPITLELRRTTPELPAVVTVAKRSESEQRARVFGGKYLSTADLKNPEYQKMSIGDVILKNHFYVPKSTGAGKAKGCVPLTILNGRDYGLGVQLETDAVNAYTAVEYYAYRRPYPIEFKYAVMHAHPELSNETIECGILILWTVPQR